MIFYTIYYYGIYGVRPIKILGAIDLDPLPFIKSQYDKIQETRVIFKESFLQNIIDEFSALMARLMYKLTNLPTAKSLISCVVLIFKISM